MKGSPIGTVGTGEKFLGAYIMGGASNNVTTSSIVKFTFRLETAANISATIGQVAYANDQSGFSNNGTAGYAAQGIQNGTLRKDVYKLLYSGETTSTLSAILSEGVYYAVAFTNGTTAGYVAGGFFTSGRSRNLDKLTYSNDTKTQVSSTFFSGERSEGAAGYSSSNGYVIGGQMSFTNDMEKVVFSSETVSTLSNVLTTDYYSHSACVNLNTSVYVWTNYYAQPSPTTVNKFNVSNDTSSALSATISSPAKQATASAWSRVNGYTLGGYKDTGSPQGGTDDIRKLSFSADTISTLSQVLPTKRDSGPAVNNN